jgi:NAD(P)-dependent dehydrogenase (short-subunit alcohol dehydrogenase family)
MKNILVIGGSSGIGQATADLLSKEAQVYATYHSHPRQNQTNLFFHPLNVLDEAADWSWLPDTLHGLVYCPGNILLKPAARITEQELIEDYRLQAVGALKAVQHALPSLKKSGDASVVLFSTVAVQTGFPFHALVSASKGAVEGMTRALAAEFAPSIRVNAIAPSITDTPLASKILGTPEKKEASAARHPLKKNGNPEELAATVSFLLGQASSFMTGQIVTMDGGISSIR